jgi:hypothetical protein
VQLKKAVPQLRGSMKVSFSAKTVFDNLKSLEQVASNLTAGRIMQRHLLVELVNHRNQLVDKYKPERYRRAKMIREDKRRLERSNGLARSEMIREAYLTVIKGSDEYNKTRTTLRNNLSSGRNPHTLAHEFGRHILDLILVGEGLGKSGITDNQQELSQGAAHIIQLMATDVLGCRIMTSNFSFRSLKRSEVPS